MNTLEVLEFYDMAPNTLRDMRRAGLPFTKVNSKSYKYDYEDVEAWINLDGKVYPKYRILLGMAKVRELTGLTKNQINNERYNHYLPFYELRGNRGVTMYRFDEQEVIDWFEGYKERKSIKRELVI